MLSQTTDRPTQEEIAARAQEIYELEGRVEGRALEHWMRAERELREQLSQPGGTNGSAQPPPPESGV
jgi:hypothetical protein